MKCCVSTDIGTWTNWLTFEHDPDHSPDAGTGLLSAMSYRLQWYDLTILTTVCNSMTITTQEKRLANADIEISQHALVTFKFFLQNLLLFISSISVGRGKLQKERHSSMMSLFAVLNNFIKNLMTTKPRECRSHLLFTNWRVTSSEAILPTLPKIFISAIIRASNFKFGIQLGFGE